MEDAAIIGEELDAGTSDDPQGIGGLEYEVYRRSRPSASGLDPEAVHALCDRRSSARDDAASAEALGSLTRMPRRLLELISAGAEGV